MTIYAGYGATQYAKKTGATIQIQSTVRGQSVEFAAFITDFSQTFASDWSPESVYGRNDPIATFQGTKRTINLSWDVPSATVEDAKKNLQNCNLLAKFMYPGYANGSKKKKPNPGKGNAAMQALEDKKAKAARFETNIISKPPLVRVSFANLIAGSSAPSLPKSESDKANKDKATKKAGNPEEKEKTTSGIVAGTGLLGYITSMNWKPAIEMGMFNSGKNLYPKVISISMDLNVLHEHFLGWDSRGWMGEGNELFKT